MLFTSYGFVGFIAAVFILYYIIPKRFQWLFLLAAGYLFYYMADPRYLVYILTTTVTVYLAAIFIGRNMDRQNAYIRTNKAKMSKEEKKAYKDRCKKARRRWVIACLILNLGILAVLKYTNFMIYNINGVLSAAGQDGRLGFVSLALPMGISFYTFQAIGYLIDVYRTTVHAEKNIFKFALFVSFFPQLVQGPISRFGDLSATLFERHYFDAGVVSRGLQRMLWGYFKKMVIADRILVALNIIIGDTGTYNGAYILAAMLFYTVELYADFTGGIDITIGIAQTMGIAVCENFERPYFSKSLKEYWRRWHITMGTWFRDYLFYPISSCPVMQKFSRFSRSHFGERVGRRIPVYLSSFIVWFATGIWHGASWNFIVWGLANWAVLMASEELEPCYAKFHKRFKGLGESAVYKLFQTGRTFLIVCCLKLFDCYRGVGDVFRMLGSMFTARNWNILWDGAMLKLGLSALDYGILAVGSLLVLSVSLAQRSGSVREKIAARPYPVRFAIWYGLFLVVLLTGAYGTGYDASQFIYNQF